MRQLLGIIFLFPFLFSCKKHEHPEPTSTGQFELNIRAKFAGQDLQYGTTYTGIRGTKLRFEDLKLYISQVRLVKEDGSEVLVKEYDLLDFFGGKTQHGGGEATLGNAPTGRYKGVRFNIGLDSLTNRKNPADFPSSHPLSVSKGMFWDWNTGFRFLSVEGKFDSLTSGTFTNSFAYHLGTNPFLMSFDYTQPQHAFSINKDQELQFILEMDVNRFFYSATDTINVYQENFTHTSGSTIPLANRIKNNVLQSFYKVPF